MKRREFIVSSVAGSVGAGLAHNPLTASSFDGTQPTPFAGRKILIAGGNFNTRVHPLHGAAHRQAAAEAAVSADRVGRFRQRRRSRGTATARRSTSSRRTRTASSRARRRRGAGKTCCSRSTASSARAAIRSTSRRSGRRRASTSILRQAWDRGIVLGGASAGSLCWFEEGTTDSRPKELSKVECLGFLKGSHSPHYDAEPGRRPLYQKLIAVWADEAGLRVRQRRGHLLRRQRRETRRGDARRRRRSITSASRTGRSSRR